MAMGKTHLNWKEKVLEWQTSGKSIQVWCIENHIPLSTFYGWKARLEKSPDKSSAKSQAIKVTQEFMELKDQPSSSIGLILECEGVKIHLQPNFNAVILRKCLDCLRGISC